MFTWYILYPHICKLPVLHIKALHTWKLKIAIIEFLSCKGCSVNYSSLAFETWLELTEARFYVYNDYTLCMLNNINNLPLSPVICIQSYNIWEQLVQVIYLMGPFKSYLGLKSCHCWSNSLHRAQCLNCNFTWLAKLALEKQTN